MNNITSHLPQNDWSRFQEILVYELDLEKVLEGLDAPPWVEVTGPGYVDAGSRATFQMRPVFGRFQPVKLLLPGKLALIKGTKVVLATDSESPTKAQRLVIEFEDKQGRKGTTLWDVNVLGKHKSEEAGSYPKNCAIGPS